MALLDETARGVYVISATPFTDTGALDLMSTDRLMDFYLQCGVDGMTILGVMGEAPKLAPEESESFVARCLKRVGKTPIVVGVSSPGMKMLGDFARRVMDMGAAGVMVTPTAGLKTEDQIYGYLESVIKELGPDIPVVLQDYPQLTGVFMSSGLINRLLTDFPSFKMFKHEDSPGLRKLSKLRAAEQDGSRPRRVSILVGNGGLYLVQELARGADGAMTGFAFPEMLVEVCRLYAAGEHERAEDVFDAYLPVVRHEQQPGIGLALRKETLRRRGILASSRVRVPGPTLDAADQAELAGLLARLERAKTRLGAPALRLAGE
jgi:4-hydroxy-tetrahydrodipicolinate synthase